MTTKFDSSYVGAVGMENCGCLGTPVTECRYSNQQLAEVLHNAAAYARKMDGLGHDTFWIAEHHFRPGGGVHPQPADGGDAPSQPDQEPPHRLRLQHRVDVASAAPGYGMDRGVLGLSPIPEHESRLQSLTSPPRAAGI